MEGGGFRRAGGGAYAANAWLQAKPDEYDPLRTNLVQGAWLPGIGCPTDARTGEYVPPDYTEIRRGPNYTDPACPPGDRRDKRNEGLLLAKTGPTTNAAAAVIRLQNLKGMTVTRLACDIRKPVGSSDPRGSHCGAGAPRWNVTTDEGTYSIGCNSPPAPTQTPGNGWVRMQWGGAAPLLGRRP